MKHAELGAFYPPKLTKSNSGADLMMIFFMVLMGPKPYQDAIQHTEIRFPQSLQTRPRTLLGTLKKHALRALTSPVPRRLPHISPQSMSSYKYASAAKTTVCRFPRKHTPHTAALNYP